MLTGAVLYATAPVFIRCLARAQLRRTFPQCTVSIGSCRTNLFREIALNDISLSHLFYAAGAGRFIIRYTPLSLFKATLTDIELQDAHLDIHLKNQPIAAIMRYLPAPGARMVRINAAEVSGFRIRIVSRDVNCAAAGTFVVNPAEGVISGIDVSVDLLQAGEIALKNAVLKAQQSSPAGEVRADGITYGKARVTGIRGRVKLTGERMLFESITADVLGGTIQGMGYMDMNETMAYRCRIAAQGLDLERFVDDFGFTEHFRMSGRLNGSLSIGGTRDACNVLDGGFQVTGAGGTLVITDKRFLENMARSSGQSLDIIMESFRDYRYNTGVMYVGARQGDLVCSVELEGGAGKRIFPVTLHYFLPQKADKGRIL